VTPVVALDSGPLSLVATRPGVAVADECRRWVEASELAGVEVVEVVVPEIVDYELRRELLRLRASASASASIARLDVFLGAVPGRLLPLGTPALRRATELWADLRRTGRPTTDPHALDVDVILAAQMLVAFPGGGFAVATTNVAHLSLLVPADDWRNL